jgi:hypothetical protein
MLLLARQQFVIIKGNSHAIVRAVANKRWQVMMRHSAQSDVLYNSSTGLSSFTADVWALTNAAGCCLDLVHVLQGAGSPAVPHEPALLIVAHKAADLQGATEKATPLHQQHG